jgi:hypothetical protein
MLLIAAIPRSAALAIEATQALNIAHAITGKTPFLTREYISISPDGCFRCCTRWTD